jgi:hypothetical protein
MILNNIFQLCTSYLKHAAFISPIMYYSLTLPKCTLYLVYAGMHTLVLIRHYFN